MYKFYVSYFEYNSFVENDMSFKTTIVTLDNNMPDVLDILRKIEKSTDGNWVKIISWSPLPY